MLNIVQLRMLQNSLLRRKRSKYQIRARMYPSRELLRQTGCAQQALLPSTLKVCIGCQMTCELSKVARRKVDWVLVMCMRGRVQAKPLRSVIQLFPCKMQRPMGWQVML